MRAGVRRLVPTAARPPSRPVSRSDPEPGAAAEDRQEQGQHQQPPTPVDAGGQRADRVPHARNASSARAGRTGSARRSPGSAHWDPVTSSPARPSPARDAGEAIVDWYATAARDLPWRRAGTDAWAVLVSEVMLQQTPVARVDPVWREWMARWPTPAALAAVAPADVIRAWGKLGYPRRALRCGRRPWRSSSATAASSRGTSRSSRRCPASAPTRPGRWPASATGSRSRSWTRTCAGWWPGCCTDGPRRATPGRRT